ncbi:MAG: N-acetyl-1-D-myo-inositol-2-amino-2-deoxy-alpha-D-glucopyranoside deacetylase [Actinomycetota bacterium]|nr:N-acetyl-1-D-myo-inositol-2-amino-2-deoxy-alpha-D-glucopyranoside deacetylase [Actinomycetota bacterium]
MTERPRMLCVHAHPDDEAIVTGGVLARYADEGVVTAVVTCTGGELGEIHNMDADAVRPRLAEVRRAELQRSLAILGAGEPRLLGYRDSGMMGTEGNDDPAAFWRASFDEAVGRLVAHIRALRPDVLVTYDPFGGYGHPDHIQAHRVALVASEACAMAALYPDAGPAWTVSKVYWAAWPKSFIRELSAELRRRGRPSPFAEDGRVGELSMGTPDDEVTTTVDVGRWLERKWAALRAHRSQLAAESFFLNLPEELRAAGLGTEWFVRHRSRVAAPTREDDLLAGLRSARD